MNQTRYLLFTGLVKHGELLHYLLAAQVRKRLMEHHQLRRQVKSSAVTGNPDSVFEVYYVEEPGDLAHNLSAIASDPIHGEIHEVIEKARINPEDRFFPLHIPPYVQTMAQMPYLLTHKGQRACAEDFAEAPYLLQVTCTLHDPGKLDVFNDHMTEVLGEFERSGLHLLVAGRHTGVLEPDGMKELPGEEKDIRILNIWQYEDPESPRLLMSRLAENLTYSDLDKICDQDQHICRNVSRHYQRYPLLQGKPLMP